MVTERWFGIAAVALPIAMGIGAVLALVYAGVQLGEIFR